MKTIFPKEKFNIPLWYVIDASNKILGKLVVKISILLMGKQDSYYTPGINQGNFVIVINSDKINVTGEKDTKKLYYSNSNRPGSLKIKTFNELKKKASNKIIEKAVWGMLPKNKIGRDYFKRLYVYKKEKLISKKIYEV